MWRVGTGAFVVFLQVCSVSVFGAYLSVSLSDLVSHMV